MRVIGTRILVRQRLTASVTKGGIELPGDQDGLPFGDVITVGSGVTGDVNLGDISRGDIVLFNPLLTSPVGVLDHHVLIELDDVLAILTEKEVADARS